MFGYSRAAIVIAAIALLGGAAVLGLVKSGVIQLPGGSGVGSSNGTQHTAAATGPLTVPLGSGPQAASYTVDAGRILVDDRDRIRGNRG